MTGRETVEGVRAAVEAVRQREQAGEIAGIEDYLAEAIVAEIPAPGTSAMSYPLIRDVLREVRAEIAEEPGDPLGWLTADLWRMAITIAIERLGGVELGMESSYRLMSGVDEEGLVLTAGATDVLEMALPGRFGPVRRETFAGARMAQERHECGFLLHSEITWHEESGWIDAEGTEVAAPAEGAEEHRVCGHPDKLERRLAARRLELCSACRRKQKEIPTP